MQRSHDEWPLNFVKVTSRSQPNQLQLNTQLLPGFKTTSGWNCRHLSRKHSTPKTNTCHRCLAFKHVNHLPPLTWHEVTGADSIFHSGDWHNWQRLNDRHFYLFLSKTETRKAILLIVQRIDELPIGQKSKNRHRICWKSPSKIITRRRAIRTQSAVCRKWVYRTRWRTVVRLLPVLSRPTAKRFLFQSDFYLAPIASDRNVRSEKFSRS